METNESWERFEQGLLRAASCCRELGKMLDAQEWKDLSVQLLVMLKKGKKFYHGRALTELEVMNLVTNMELAQKLAQNPTVQ
jgi:hypothetical protein